MLISCLALAVIYHSGLTSANTEKVIFVAPALTRLPDTKPGTELLDVQSVVHDSRLRTSLDVAFESEDQPQGIDHWYLLRHLNAKQRYELRVCWAATVSD